MIFFARAACVEIVVFLFMFISDRLTEWLLIVSAGFLASKLCMVLLESGLWPTILKVHHSKKLLQLRIRLGDERKDKVSAVA